MPTRMYDNQRYTQRCVLDPNDVSLSLHFTWRARLNVDCRCCGDGRPSLKGMDDFPFSDFDLTAMLVILN